MNVSAAAPCLVAVFEVEGPTRLWHTAASDADLDALEAWLAAGSERRTAVAALLEDRDRTGRIARGVAWEAELCAAAPRETVAALTELVLELEAELRALRAALACRPPSSVSSLRSHKNDPAASPPGVTANGDTNSDAQHRR